MYILVLLCSNVMQIRCVKQAYCIIIGDSCQVVFLSSCFEMIEHEVGKYEDESERRRDPVCWECPW